MGRDGAVKRAFRKMFRMDQETPEQREARERLEFFRSLPPSEQRRLVAFFAECFESCESGEYVFTATKSIGAAA